MPRRYKLGADGQAHPAYFGKLPEEFTKEDTPVSYTHLPASKEGAGKAVYPENHAGISKGAGTGKTAYA